MTTWLAPATLEEALASLAETRAEILAGGTDLWPKWSSGQPRPERVLSLHRLGALRGIALEAGVLRIGAACTHSELARSEAVRRACPALAEAALTVGAIQIQNQGTIGGNLANASPAADLPPPLVAAGAEVELASARGGTRWLPLDAFYLGYRRTARREDELLTEVRLPALPAGARERFRKVGTRRAQSIAKVAVAGRIALAADGTIARAGIALGSVGPTVVRLAALEAWLCGRAPDAETARAAEARARAAVQPIDDLRSSADYRRHVAGRLVHNLILDL